MKVTDRALTIVGWAGTILVALAVGRFAAVDPRWDAYLVWLALAGVTCVVIYAARSAAENRGVALLAAGVAALIAINVLGGSYSRRWDLTAGQVFALAPETQASLRRLDAPVRVLVFAEPAELPAYRDRLKEYGETSGLVTVEYVDDAAQPALARQYDVQASGTLVIEHKGRAERVDAASEQEFTNALIRLQQGRTRKAYFTTGHAERDTASTERVGYSNIAAALQRDNFLVETINIAQDGSVPDDATVVIVAGPRADFFRAEIEALRGFLQKGGAILFLVDPFEDLKRYITETGVSLFMMDPASVSATGELRNLTAFILEQGAELGNDVVVDASDMGQYLGTDASVPVAARYPSHPITSGLTSLSAYPMARSVKAVARDGKTVSAIIETSDRTWTETDIQQLAAGRLSMDPDKGDRPGPVSLGVAVSAPSSQPPAAGSPYRETRTVTVGDSDLVANYSANIPGNAEMILSIVHWLAQDTVVTIPPRVPQQRSLSMTSSQQRNLLLIAVLLLPGLAVATAAYTRKGIP